MCVKQKHPLKSKCSLMTRLILINGGIRFLLKSPPRILQWIPGKCERNDPMWWISCWVAQSNFPQHSFTGWMCLLRVLWRSKLFLAMKAVKKRKSFTKALFVTKLPGLRSLFSIISCLALMNWFESCSFRNYQIKEKKIAGEIFHWELWGRKPV